MSDPDSQYLASLDAQSKALDDRETALEAKYKADLAAIASERIGVEQARKHFTAYLAGKGAAAPPTSLVQRRLNGLSKGAIPLPSRIGDQHHLMLNVLYYSHDVLSARQIAEKAGMQSKVVYTFASRDIDDGIVERADSGFRLTSEGRDFMIRLTQKFGAPKHQKAPPARAGGAIQ